MDSHTKDSLIKARSRVMEFTYIKKEAFTKETSQMIVDKGQEK